MINNSDVINLKKLNKFKDNYINKQETEDGNSLSYSHFLN